MKPPIITIIVPVYNAEKYLHRCVDSILAQTFADFELLLIDDGSKDNSGAICDEYAAKDSRVRVFHKENGGVSSARNMGLDNAKGEWICFVDSDDYLYNKLFLTNLSGNREDLIITSHIETSYNKKEVVFILDGYKTNLHKKEFTDFISQYINSNIIKTPWGKFYKKKIIKDLRFDINIRCGEDLLFNLYYMINVKSCCIKQNSVYAYFKDDVDFYSKYQQSINDSIYTLTKIYEAYEKNNLVIPNFERQIFFDYKSLCQEEINLFPKLWYKNVGIKRVYSKIKKNMGWDFRIRYAILENQFASTIWGKIKSLFYA